MRRIIHDLNNALAVVAINVGLLREETSDHDPASELLEEVGEAVSRAGGLTQQLRRCIAESSSAWPSDAREPPDTRGDAD